MSVSRSSSATAASSFPRTLVLCFDGTNGRYDSTNTNVVKFCGLLRKDCPEHQRVYYQPGIGTYFAPGVVSPLWTSLASLLDEAVAWYLDAHVMGGYKFLMDNYRDGDKICLFGFSRGAYTARALAGMLDKVGLLPKGNLQQVNFAYKAYTRTDKEGIDLAAGFKQTFSQNVQIDFLGVWDTVQSTGVLISRELPFTDSNAAVRVFRHALSLDERRARFRPKLYHWPTPDEGSDPVVDQQDAATGMSGAVVSIFKRLFKRKYRSDESQRGMRQGTLIDTTQCSDEEAVPNSDGQLETNLSPEEPCPPDVLEVWFSGCHSDVGGGNVEDGVDTSLAQITLHWMVDHVMRSECGILFDNDSLSHIGFTFVPSQPPPVTCGQGPPNSHVNNINAIAPISAVTGTTRHYPWAYKRIYDESLDAKAPLYDQLKINKLWWILEILPVSDAWQDNNRVWHNEWRINLGRGRHISSQNPKFHHTVKERMDCGPLKYVPRAIYDHHEIYV